MAVFGVKSTPLSTLTNEEKVPLTKKKWADSVGNFASRFVGASQNITVNSGLKRAPKKKKSKLNKTKSPTAGDSTAADDANQWKNFLRFFLVGAAAADASAYVFRRHPAAAERRSRA